MGQFPYEFSIVGQDTIPNTSRNSWAWLEDQAKALKDGQALRLVKPKGTSVSTVISAWLRICKRLKVNRGSRTLRQADGSHLIFLWRETKDSTRR